MRTPAPECLFVLPVRELRVVGRANRHGAREYVLKAYAVVAGGRHVKFVTVMRTVAIGALRRHPTARVRLRRGLGWDNTAEFACANVRAPGVIRRKQRPAHVMRRLWCSETVLEGIRIGANVGP